MKDTNNKEVGQGVDHMDLEMIELGQVTEETKGSNFGASGDGGGGFCWC